MTHRIATLSLGAIAKNMANSTPAKSGTTTTVGGQLRDSSVADLILGPENALASFALRIHATDDATPLPIDTVPVTFYAPSGYGKSHLLQRVAANWNSETKSDQFTLIEATDFARSYAQAVRLDDVHRFQQRFQRIGLLLIDNIDDLRRKSGAQHQLATTIDHRRRQARPTVFTIRKQPHASGLATRLVSRLMNGLFVPLALPGPETTAAILERLCCERSIEMTPAAVRLLSHQDGMSVPYLSGFVNQLAACSLGQDSPITTPRPLNVPPKVIDVADVKRLLDASSPQQIDVRNVIRVTANYFGLQQRNLSCKSRRKMDVLARSIAMYLIRKHTEYSFQQIGNRFGKRDHTTVMHACKKIEEDQETDAITRSALVNIENRLNLVR